MFASKKFAILPLILLVSASASWSQIVAPARSPSYVSGGAIISKVDGTTVTQVLNHPGSNFESLAIGPDWVDQDAAGNAKYPFLLYACDTALNQVIRLDPANGSAFVVVGTVSFAPVCGRSSAAGDFYVTNKAGSGVWKFAGLANVPFASTTFPAPTELLGPPATSAGMTGAGITQKNVGDLLIVDKAENKILRSPYDTTQNFSTAVTFASTNLNGPVGIARFSNGDVFAANSVVGSGRNATPEVVHFNGSGASAGSCPTISLKTNETLQFLASAENDVLYLVTQANSSGTIWTWDATQTCTLTQLATVKNSISGIAVGPVPTATISQDLTATVQNPTPTTFMFNSNAFQIVGTGCTTQPTVTEYPISPATVKGMISLAGSSLPDGATPTTNLGEGGYSAAYVAKFDTCGSVFTDGAIVNSIYGLFDNLIANNTRILRCDGSTHEPLLDAGTTTCQAATTIGEYPLGGIIPDDLGTTIKTLSNSTFVLVNAKPTTNESAIFCPYQSPLVNTTDPKKAAVFSAGTKNTLSVKFKLAAASGSCQNGPYITDASALISVAMLTGDVKTFHTIPIASTSVGLADAQPLYNSGNQQYQFTLSLNGYAPGLYSLNTTLLTDNTFDSQNISAQTIVFRIK